MSTVFRHQGSRAAMALALALGTSSILAVAPVAAVGEPPHMVKDIRPGDNLGSYPSELTAVGDVLYFSARDKRHGREPWTSDGTSDGTVMLKNIAPGSGGSKPAEFTQIGNLVFFSANNGSTGRELWVTNGTSAGTVQVKDIRVGSKGSSPTELTAVGNTLFFTANDGSTGRELWKSDGTAAGTVQVKNLNPPCGVGPSDLTSFGGKLFFAIHFAFCSGPIPTSPFWGDLWRSDGTEAGTNPFTDRDHASIYNPSNLVVSGPYLYFVAENQWPTITLWRTDGRSSTTKPIKGGLYPENLTDVGGTLFFTDSSTEPGALWKSNGTRASTVLIANENEPSQLTAVGNFLYFTTREPNGEQPLWVSNGTPEGTDTWAGANWGNGILYENLTEFDGTLYYTMATYLLLFTTCPPNGDCSEGWVQTHVPGATYENAGFFSSNFTAVGSTLFFSAQANGGDPGIELWAYTP